MVSSRGMLGDLLIWIFIILLASFSVYYFVFLPKGWIYESINPVVLDASNVQEIVFSRLSDYEFPYGVEYGFGERAKYARIKDFDVLSSDDLLVISDKVLSCRVQVRNGDVLVNELFCGGERGRLIFQNANALPHLYLFSTNSRFFTSEDGLEDYLVAVTVVAKGDGYDRS